jgi:hypothetical protein
MARITASPASNTFLLRELRDLQRQSRDALGLTVDSSERVAQILGEEFKLPLKAGERIQAE